MREVVRGIVEREGDTCGHAGIDDGRRWRTAVEHERFMLSAKKRRREDAARELKVRWRGRTGWTPAVRQMEKNCERLVSGHTILPRRDRFRLRR